MTTRFVEGERVRVDIPDETDPDHDFHGQHGKVKRVLSDDAGRETGDSRDSVLYRIRFPNGSTVDLRWRDLRPPLDGDDK